MSGDIAGHGIVWTASCCKKCCTIRALWPSAVVHEHWAVSQRTIVKMGDLAWSEHIVTVFLACQITIKNVEVQLTVKGKTTPDSYTPPPKAVVPKMWLSWNEVFRWRQTLAWASVVRSKTRLSSDQWTRLHVRIVHPKWSCDQSNRAWRWRNVNWTFYGSSRSHSLKVEASDYSACANVASKHQITTQCTSCTERPLPRPSGYEPVLSRRSFARSTCTWTVSNIPRLTKTLHQSYNDGMVNPEVVCHPSMAKTTGMHANSLPPFWYG
jgi:hypothetical protein